MSRFAAVALVIGLFAGCGSGATQRLDRAVAKAKELGLATTVDEMNALYEPASGAGNGPFSALEELIRDPNVRKVMEFPTAEAIRSSLQAIGTRAHLFEIAAKTGSLPKHRDWRWNDVFLPEYSRIKDVVRFLCARARFRGQIGDPSGCIADIRLVAGLIARMADDPTLIGKLVNSAMISIWCSATSLSAQHMQKSAASLKNLAAIAKALPEPDYGGALSAELVMVRLGSKDLQSDRIKFEESLPAEDTRLIGNPSKSDFILAEAKIIEGYTLLAGFWKDREAVLSLAKQFEDKHRRGDTSDRLAATILRVMARAKDGETRIVALMRTLRIGLAALTHRARHGRLPSLAMASRAAGVPHMDPFSDKDYVYTTVRALRVYSVGINGRDEGGKFGFDGDDIAGFDVTLR